MAKSVASSSAEEGMKSLSLSTTPKNIEVVSFAVSIPNIIDGIEMDSEGGIVVGTVTFMNKSAMIWIGWGDIEPEKSADSSCIGNCDTVGTGTPMMGPLVVAMPRTKFSGVSRNSEEAPCSQLISGSSDEEMMLGWQMASRLSRKIGWPIFVSCSLGSNITGMESGSAMNNFNGLSAQRAAAFSEREVGKILADRKASLDNP
mmetsp:Transcript_23693/g.27947  ORF Transcript_23693/g.27947 Transcript_23693/m.27947 type:complete len:202 (-) Transcript_23693:58-663(-)|eukprot:CAMPEP_0198251228 /NCGR_PEP_ID=MMETSP1447-20131203/2129_1 /TAXON_ID=420782 /ORGANISM="Chaetoceros dichaeta, Strain CCMP1751" /LENGTH=201 /DNA_ID=CAMNT_0043936197 /DNA_START=40 /DNA_END=645 /DNA_ORIENTATION=+